MTRLRQETTRSYIHAVKERWKNSRLATITMEVLRRSAILHPRHHVL